MLFFVDPQCGVPIFRQLMDQVKLHVANGMLKPGDELPSIRSLSIPLGVNPMTISKAYNLLVHDNVLERRPGLPLVVAAIGAEEMLTCRDEQLRAGLQPAVNLVQQLEISPDEALKTFQSMLNEIGRSNSAQED